MSGKAVIIYSGGMDSTVLLYDLIAQGFDVTAMSFNYGQRHIRELYSAAEICKSLVIPHKVIDMAWLAALLPGSSQTDMSVDVPEGHYAEESMKLTVVPNRNMIMLAVAAGHAMAIGAGHVAFAVHSGDHAIYPDCRLEFVEAIRSAVLKADWNPVVVTAPYLFMDKGDIAKRGHDLKVPFERTWTCYKGGLHHCGVCGSCTERRESFLKHKVPDPTAYLKMR
jgi:7-cyano-7-deazaguanine synthase